MFGSKCQCTFSIACIIPNVRTPSQSLSLLGVGELGDSVISAALDSFLSRLYVRWSQGTLIRFVYLDRTHPTLMEGFYIVAFHCSTVWVVNMATVLVCNLSKLGETGCYMRSLLLVRFGGLESHEVPRKQHRSISRENGPGYDWYTELVWVERGWVQVLKGRLIYCRHWVSSNSVICNNIMLFETFNHLFLIICAVLKMHHKKIFLLFY